MGTEGLFVYTLIVRGVGGCLYYDCNTPHTYNVGTCRSKGRGRHRYTYTYIQMKGVKLTPGLGSIKILELGLEFEQDFELHFKLKKSCSSCSRISLGQHQVSRLVTWTSSHAQDSLWDLIDWSLKELYSVSNYEILVCTEVICGTKPRMRYRKADINYICYYGLRKYSLGGVRNLLCINGLMVCRYCGLSCTCVILTLSGGLLHIYYTGDIYTCTVIMVTYTYNIAVCGSGVFSITTVRSGKKTLIHTFTLSNL